MLKTKYKLLYKGSFTVDAFEKNINKLVEDRYFVKSMVSTNDDIYVLMMKETFVPDYNEYDCLIPKDIYVVGCDPDDEVE